VLDAGGDVRRTWLRVLLAAVAGIPLALGVVLMASRVGDEARFVTWPVVAFTVLAAAVAVVGTWTGSLRPSLLAAGVLPAVLVSYFLPAAPFPFVALVLVAVGAWAIAAGGMASGVAAGVGILMVVFVVLQGPAVECGVSSVSASSGPWWIEEPSSSSVSGASIGVAPSGSATGTVQVGDHLYRYRCEGDRLTRFERSTA
jgi:hypothetical protein